MNRRVEDTLVRLVHIPLDRMRARAYRKGKRPRPGTVLFSPSMDMKITARETMAKFVASVEEASRQACERPPR